MKLRRVEAAFLVAVAISLLVSVFFSSEGEALADKVVRLHVIANSDSEADQSLKLIVRDSVLDYIRVPLGDAASQAEAAAIISELLPAVRDTAARIVSECGYDYEVYASLTNETYPTREYDNFTLPAGTYQSLRIIIGSGEGHNWWCVVYPPLCEEIAVKEVATTQSPDADSSGISRVVPRRFSSKFSDLSTANAKLPETPAPASPDAASEPSASGSSGDLTSTDIKIISDDGSAVTKFKFRIFEIISDIKNLFG